MHKVYDVLIVGGGPGGYTAALYAARAGLSVAVLEKLSAGGQMALTTQVDNYPGFPDGVDGFALAEDMCRQAERFGAETVLTEVTALSLQGPVKQAHTTDGVFHGKTLIIATGASPRKLGIGQEDALVGRGVNYCAACDGMFYRDKVVVVVGGGNSAAADALLLSRIAKKVILVHRRDSLRATHIYHQPLMDAENLEFCWNSTVKSLLQEGKLTGVELENINTGEITQIACDGIFISIGRQPANELVKDLMELDPAGYIPADETTATTIPGVYAVGDVRTKQLRQIVTAVADGAAAAHSIEQYLAENK